MGGGTGTVDGFVRAYLRLVRGLGRLAPGLVDTGSLDGIGGWPADPVPRPSDLVRHAGRLAAELADLPVEPARRAFLAGQLRAVECTARRLTGQPVPFVREVRECFDVRPRPGVADEYAAAHAELDALLPGVGPLAGRLADYRRAHEVPVARVGAALAAVRTLLRERVREQVPLPAAESVTFQLVDDAPWAALHQYRAGCRSRVLVNAAAPPRRTQLAQVVAHEAYPGHHTERCRKELGIVGAGWLEHGAQLANSPQSLLAEGAAELGPAAVLGPGWGPRVAEVLAGEGLGFDGELAERVDAVLARLAPVRQDAALLLHDRGLPPDDVLAYLVRWLAVDEHRARQMLRFLAHPVWRAYTTTYVEGRDLVRRWWERDPGPARLCRLLDEPLTPTALRAELAS